MMLWILDIVSVKEHYDFLKLIMEIDLYLVMIRSTPKEVPPEWSHQNTQLIYG